MVNHTVSRNFKPGKTTELSNSNNDESYERQKPVIAQL